MNWKKRNRNGVKFTCPKSPHNQYMLEHAGGSLKLSVFDPMLTEFSKNKLYFLFVGELPLFHPIYFPQGLYNSNSQLRENLNFG